MTRQLAPKLRGRDSLQRSLRLEAGHYEVDWSAESVPGYEHRGPFSVSIERSGEVVTDQDNYYVSVVTVEGFPDDAFRYDVDFLYGVTGGTYLLNVDAYGLDWEVTFSPFHPVPRISAPMEFKGSHSRQSAPIALQGGSFRLDWRIESLAPDAQLLVSLHGLSTDTVRPLLRVSGANKAANSGASYLNSVGLGDYYFDFSSASCNWAIAIEPVAPITLTESAIEISGDRTDGAPCPESPPMYVEFGDVVVTWAATFWATGSKPAIFCLALITCDAFDESVFQIEPPITLAYGRQQNGTALFRNVPDGFYCLRILPEKVDWSVKIIHRVANEKPPASISPLSAPASDYRDSKDSPLEKPPAGGPAHSRGIETILTKLNSLVGLDGVKNDVTSLVNFLQVRQWRTDHRLPIPSITLHSVFLGNPGTGKTTVARLLADIYRTMGILKRGHLIETDQAGLIGGYLGQTALKTKEVVESAIGGVLFIDEAYAITDRPGIGADAYGKEAISELLKLMEDHRDDLIVIAAGYPDKMDGFLSSNPGLRSRFTRTFTFADYSVAELRAIFMGLAKQAGYVVTEEAKVQLDQVLSRAYAARGSEFGNGRFVRTLFERAIGLQADRIAASLTITKDLLVTLAPEDIPRDIESVK